MQRDFSTTCQDLYQHHPIPRHPSTCNKNLNISTFIPRATPEQFYNTYKLVKIKNSMDY